MYPSLRLNLYRQHFSNTVTRPASPNVNLHDTHPKRVDQGTRSIHKDRSLHLTKAKGPNVFGKPCFSSAWKRCGDLPLPWKWRWADWMQMVRSRSFMTYNIQTRIDSENAKCKPSKEKRPFPTPNCLRLADICIYILTILYIDIHYTL